MDYELAKELKDAGFPQGRVDIVGNHRIFPNSDHLGYGQKVDDVCYLPTLSELIEACEPAKADEFWVGTHIDVWEAILNYHGYFDYPTKFKDDEGFASVELKEEGATPDVAVAKLWLALNKKS